MTATLKMISTWKHLKRWKKISVLFVLFISIGVYIFATFFLENIIRKSLSKELTKQFGTYYDIQFDSRDQSFNGISLSMTFTNIVISTDTTHEFINKYPVIFFKGEALKVESLSAWSYLFGKNINLDKIVLVNGDLDFHQIDKDPKYKEKEKKKRKQSKLAKVNIGEFGLENVNFSFWNKEMEKKKMVDVTHLVFRLEELDLNMKHLDNILNKLKFEQVYLGFDHLEFNPSKGMFSYKIDSVRMDYEQQTLNVYNVQTIENKDKIAYTASLPYAKMMINITVPHLSITQLDYDQLIKNTQLKAKSISLNDFKLGLFKNNHLKMDKNRFQGLIQDILLDSPLGIAVDTIHVQNGDLVLDLLSKKRSTVSSELELSNICGVINHAIVDSTSSIPTEFRLTANIQGKGLLNFNMDFDYSNPTMEHRYWGSLHDMPLKAWNGFLFNFANIRFKQGNIKLLKFDGIADRNKTWGEVEFYYNSLKIGLSAKDGKHHGLFRERKFITSLANTIIRNDNPDKYGKNKIGHFHFDRVTYKGHFHLFVMGIIDGVEHVILEDGITSMMDKRNEHKKHAKN